MIFQSDLSGASSFIQELTHHFVLSTKTVYAPFTGKMMARAFGGAGGGARAPTGGNASGGGSGEYLIDIVNVVAGDAVTITIGAGGALQATAGTNGNAGGDTTVSLTGYTGVAKGGGGGQQAASGAVAGGIGGTGGSGGTAKAVRSPGGRGGLVSGAGNTNKLTGGGGVNIFLQTSPDATRGGDITQNDATVRGTGGGGCGGRGGDITTSATAVTCGGGSGGPGVDNASTPGSLNYLGEVSASVAAEMLQNLAAILPFSYFCGSVTGAAGGGGAGGSSSASSGYAGGRLGGGGGAPTNGGAGGLAAGGGGGGANQGAPGGKGFAYVVFVR